MYPYSLFNQKIVDRVFYTLGELEGVRTRRDEEEKYVQVYLDIPNGPPSENKYNHYILRWNTGNTLSIYYIDNSTLSQRFLTTINLNVFSPIERTRDMANMITVILLSYAKIT